MIQKKFFLLFIIVTGTVTAISGQTGYGPTEVNSILRKASDKLNQLKAVRYNYKREILYSDEQYHHTLITTVLIDLTPHNADKFRFQAEDSKFLACYNGNEYFGADKAKKTIDIKKSPSLAFLGDISSLYNSILTLRNVLPLLTSNENIKKNISDSIIGNRPVYKVQLELYDHYFGNPGGMLPFTSAYTGDRHKPYELLIDKQTFLPLRFTTLFKDRPKDFISAHFLDLDTDPVMPDESSWLPATYALEYAAPKPKEQLIKQGTVPADWTLPAYSPVQAGSVSLHQYRGKVVMLDFWVKSCGPCIASFPHLNRLQQKFGTDAFQLISINAGDRKEDVAFFHNKFKPGYMMLFDGKSLAERYGIPHYPTIIILDKAGKVVYIDDNGFDQEAVEKIIQANM